MKPFAVSTRSSMLLLLLLVAGTFRQAVCSQNGDGQKNTVPKTDGKQTDKQPQQAAATTVARPFVAPPTPSQQLPPPPRNSTNVTAVVGLAAAAAGAVAQTAPTPLDPSNVTHSSALDDAQLQRTLLKPKFLTENSSTVVAQTGVASRISCLVANLGDCVVSWIRRRDYRLLTVGLSTYTEDLRFQSLHHVQTGDWTLQIKYVQLRDAGLYECQISSHPPKSIFINLKVVEAQAEIAGASEKYLMLNSPLHLECVVRQSPVDPVYIFWYHDSRMINYDIDRGVNVTSNLPNKHSALYIERASRAHSGNYTCAPSNAFPANTVIHILNGENPAAMQHGHGRSLNMLSCPSIWILIPSLVMFINFNTN
uniref:Ig-like domain-containing protein n=1 Tax=Sipha flava TaxID=143950 RepID=A0A2S2QVG0_9HEMI